MKGTLFTLQEAGPLHGSDDHVKILVPFPYPVGDVKILSPIRTFMLNTFTLKKNTGKNNGFPFLDVLGYLKNTHKNPKFGRVRQLPIRELGWEFPGWDLSHFAKFGIFMGIL